MRYSTVAFIAALTASAAAASPMNINKRGGSPQSSMRPYPSGSGLPFPTKGPVTSPVPFPSWKPNPSHKPMPSSMAEECDYYDHFYWSSDCDDECKYSYDVYYYYEDCTACDKSLQPAYPTYECTTVVESTDCSTAAAPTYTQKTVTVTVEPTEGCDEFLKANPACTYCETTVTSKTQATSYVTSTPCTTETEEATCAAVTVTITTTPCTTLATITPCVGCNEEYVTEQGQTVSSCITSTSACSTYCTETSASMCVYGAMTTTVTYPTTITYTATTSCASTDSYCDVWGKQYPCPTTIYYETVTTCTTGVFTLGGMTSECPTSACTVTYPTYCPTTTTYAWYSTVTSACESCPVATVTAADCSITSVTTGYKATSTYCPTPGVYTCGTDTVTVPSPTWVYYVELCPTNYVCSYEDWCSSKKHFIVYEYIGTWLQDMHECDTDEWEQTGPWVHQVPASKYFPEPTICIINDIEINITIAPTWYTYNTWTTDTTTTTTTTTWTTPTWAPSGSGYPSGSIRPQSRGSHPSSAPGSSPSSPPVVSNPGTYPPGSFSLTGSIGGVDVVLVAVNGQLVGSTDPNAVGTAFLSITDGILEDTDGNIYVLVGLNQPITYHAGPVRLAKRDLDIFWLPGPVATLANSTLSYSACNSTGAATIDLGFGTVPGCGGFTPVVVDPGSNPAGVAPSSGPSSTPAGPTSTGLSGPQGNGTFPTSSPTGGSGPQQTSNPSGSPSGNAPAPAPTGSNNGTNGSPAPAPAPAPTPSNGNNSTNNSTDNSTAPSNSTVFRRDFQRRFVY